MYTAGTVSCCVMPFFLPFDDQVISLGHGREGESGHVTPNDQVKPGDLVYVKDPFGIGELDTSTVQHIGP